VVDAAREIFTALYIFAAGKDSTTTTGKFIRRTAIYKRAWTRKPCPFKFLGGLFSSIPKHLGSNLCGLCCPITNLASGALLAHEARLIFESCN
jgi:hypothetical protein